MKCYQWLVVYVYESWNNVVMPRGRSGNTTWHQHQGYESDVSNNSKTNSSLIIIDL